MRGQDLVRGPDDIDQRGVEGASSQIVDQDPGALGGDGCRFAVRVLETGGTGLVEHRGDAETGCLEGLECQQPLGPVGVGGHGNDRPGTTDVNLLVRQLSS